MIETAHFPTVQGQIELSTDSSRAGRTEFNYTRLALARLFVVFLSTPSETATINPCQLGLPPIWGFAAAEVRGIYGKEISPRSFATYAIMERAVATTLRGAAGLASPQ